jgi:hypothetical protein
MATIEQVRAQIRFALEQVSARNGHHEFEHLCRHFTRQRICSNVLPATGPVSAGGDQARDFETFRTYLAGTSIADSSFVGRAAENPIAFCCTLQKSPKSKIKTDVKTLMGSGTEIDAIYCFCSDDIPVGQRHELQAWARAEHKVHLEVLDGQALSEQLSDPDIFWIAEQYLQIPREIYPDRPAPENWYAAIRTRWKEDDEPLLTPAEFFAAKSAARHALAAEEVDIGFWLEVLGKFEGSSPDETISTRASYEMAVLSLRSGRTLHGHEDRLRKYFRQIIQLDEPEQIDDIVNLLQYTWGAQFRNQVSIPAEEIARWWSQAKSRLTNLLGAATTATRKALLLELLGRLSLTRLEPDGTGAFDADAAMKYWLDAIPQIVFAPLFPLERFANFITQALEFLGEHNEYGHLTEELDRLISARAGDDAAASHARDRAMAFFKKRRFIKAIAEFQSTKIKWFTDETLRGGILSLLMLSQCYSELGLLLAAKYYALAAIFLICSSGKNSIRKMQPRAYSTLSALDYRLGNWFDAIALSRIAMGSHFLEAQEPETFEKHPGIHSCVFHAGQILALGERIDPVLTERAAKHLEDCPFHSWIAEVRALATSHWGGFSEVDLWRTIEQEFTAVPFADAEPVRAAKWDALGITWNVTWQNSFEVHVLAEYVVAILQIFLADLAGMDLYLLPTSVEVEIVRAAAVRVVDRPSNTTRLWEVGLPNSFGAKHDDWKDASDAAIQILGTLLAEISVMKSEDLLEMVRRRFEDGLSHKLLAGLPYPFIYRTVMSSETFNLFSRSGTNRLPEDRHFKVVEPTDMGWVGNLGPGYSRQKADEALANRYSIYLQPVRLTVKRIVETPGFRSTVGLLRKEGWLDWHLLGAVCCVAVNYRLTRNRRTEISPEALNKAFQQAMSRQEEDNDSQIPVTEFSEEALRLRLNTIMMSTLNIMGFECRQRTPDFAAIGRFLGERFNYWRDDIPHEDLFSFTGASGG